MRRDVFKGNLAPCDLHFLYKIILSSLSLMMSTTLCSVDSLMVLALSWPGWLGSYVWLTHSWCKIVASFEIQSLLVVYLGMGIKELHNESPVPGVRDQSS